MAATGNEVALLSQIKKLKDWITSKFDSKIDLPAMLGEEGDILVYQTPGTMSIYTSWSNPLDAIPSATQTSKGLMTAADKKKLDGLGDSNVDVVRVSSHQASYDRDTLEIVTDSTGKVTSMYFMTAD